MKTALFLLFFCCLFFDLSNGQTCTSPVYSNSGVIIRGPCPSSQVIAPVGSTVILECSSTYTGFFHSFWNVTNIEPFVSPNGPSNSNIGVSGDNTGTTLTLLVTEEDSLGIQCGLCKGGNCYQSPLQPTVLSLPVQLISFGK